MSDSRHNLAQVQRALVEGLRAIASDPQRALEAVRAGLEDEVDRLVGLACKEAGVEPAEYVKALQGRADWRIEVQEHLSALLQHPSLDAARVETRVRGLQRGLYVLRFAHTGEEPPPWVWTELEAGERARIAGLRESGTLAIPEPDLVSRVEHAIGKLEAEGGRFGICEDCQGPIRWDRIELLPYAERCTDCQRQREPSSPPASPVVALVAF